MKIAIEVLKDVLPSESLELSITQFGAESVTATFEINDMKFLVKKSDLVQIVKCIT